MELAIGKTDFARTLSAVSKAIEARNTIPILHCVRLTATAATLDQPATLQVTGTDLDITVTDTAPADIIAPGAVCVDAKLLSSIVAKVGGDINLKLEADKLIVKSGRSRFTLSVLPATDFPDLPEQKYDAEFEIDLAGFFGPVQHAISTELTRYYLCGIYFLGTSSETVAVATDGHRLSKFTGEPVGEFAGVIVPAKTVGLLPKGGCRVAVSSERIRIVQGDMTIVSKLIEGTFPDYGRVIPASQPHNFTVDREEFMRAAERVVTISSERGRAAKLSVAGSSVVLSARSDVGDASDEVAAEYTGEPVEIGFNSAYLRDMLSVPPNGRVHFAVDPGCPGIVKSDDMPTWTGILMPTRC